MTTANNAPISFRLTDDELELLRQHQQDGEKSLNLTAKRLLLNALGVDAKKSSLQFVNTVDTNQIKELIETAVQEKLTEFTTVDNVDTVKNLIAESLENGDIKDAISTSYAGMMGNFNELLEQLQELKKQVQELQSVPVVVVPQLTTGDDLTEIKSDNSPTTNYQLPITDEEQAEKNRQSHEEYVETYLTPKPEKQRLDPAIYTRNYQIVSMLGCQYYMDGKKINNEELIKNKIGENIKNNKVQIESMLGIKIETKQSVIQRFRSILKAMGFDVILDGKGCYKISNPEIFN